MMFTQKKSTGSLRKSFTANVGQRVQVRFRVSSYESGLPGSW